jgi:hypothetical protein
MAKQTTKIKRVESARRFIVGFLLQPNRAGRDWVRLRGLVVDVVSLIHFCLGENYFVAQPIVVTFKANNLLYFSRNFGFRVLVTSH